MEKFTRDEARESPKAPKQQPRRAETVRKREKSQKAASRTAAALKDGVSVLKLAPEQVRGLAPVLGNSRLLALFSGGKPGPEIFSFSCPGDSGEEECNQIHAAAPALTEPPDTGIGRGLPHGTFDPENLRDRAETLANYPDLFGVLREPK